MQSVKVGDRVQFFYNGKSRAGIIENQWDENGIGSKFRAAGFCLDEGMEGHGPYKSYSRNKVSFLAKRS
jgi:hypothetical protein